MRRSTLASRHRSAGEVGGLSLGLNVESGRPLVLLYSDDLGATVTAGKDAGGTIAEEP
jgi:predicted enzyme related to lactoylglutathione lyase